MSVSPFEPRSKLTDKSSRAEDQSNDQAQADRCGLGVSRGIDDRGRALGATIPDTRRGSGAEAPGGPAAKDSEAASPASTALNEARLATAREIVQREMQRIESTVTPAVEDAPVWSRRWMDEELRLRTDPAARLAAIADHLERAKRLEQFADNPARTGQTRQSDALKARYYRLEAEQILLEARTTYGNLPISSPGSKGARDRSGSPAPPRRNNPYRARTGADLGVVPDRLAPSR